ncbi:hypothetical protein GCM10010918_04450 [Paenibacillus radicis (ex Gao et al. 2016)]|uniref:Uncharacterized protein n=1 Tax=Paenibacillus radicis (ex Gao et al. 2016) TaxID=1737354 RepID=A0A917GR29_9BACL|nr:hypothetical protein GCM10010918_04450 [Paenibacillus radicis (ex Gao et al. 2016)]
MAVKNRLPAYNWRRFLIDPGLVHDVPSSIGMIRPLGRKFVWHKVKAFVRRLLIETDAFVYEIDEVPDLPLIFSNES